MFEKFLSANAGDFRQRYEGTFGFYRDEKGKRLLVQLTRIRDNICSFVDARGVEYKMNPDTVSDIGFLFLPPKAQFYNTEDGVVLATRVAARQFQRGVSGKNTYLYQLGKHGFDQLRTGFEALEKVYLKNVAPAEAYSRWDKLSAVALSPQIAACRESKNLFLFDQNIGTFTKEGNHFVAKLTEPDLWRTEVSDAFRSVGCTSEVS